MMRRRKCVWCPFCGRSGRGSPASPAYWTVLAGLVAQLVVRLSPDVLANVWDGLTRW